jgi:hypothetical protein
MDLTINGTSHTVDLPDDMPLLWALRDGPNITSVTTLVWCHPFTLGRGPSCLADFATRQAQRT